MLTDLIAPWLPRFLPIASIAFVGGLLYLRIGVWTSAAAAAALCLLYVWHMRPLYASLPLDPRVTGVLVRFGLIPSPELASMDEVSAVSNIGRVAPIDEARL